MVFQQLWGLVETISSLYLFPIPGHITLGNVANNNQIHSLFPEINHCMKVNGHETCVV